MTRTEADKLRQLADLMEHACRCAEIVETVCPIHDHIIRQCGVCHMSAGGACKLRWFIDASKKLLGFLDGSTAAKEIELRTKPKELKPIRKLFLGVGDVKG